MSDLLPYFSYSFIKTIHIISATLLFGTGLGTYFFMLGALRNPVVAALKRTAETVVLADWVFTTPAVVTQLVTGVLLMGKLGVHFNSLWFFMVALLTLLVGGLWLPVVWMQLQMRSILAGLPDDGVIPERFWRLARLWELFGYPAFLSGPFLIALMVYKPWMH